MYDALITLRTDTPTENAPLTKVLSILGIETITRAIALQVARSVQLPKTLTSKGYYVHSVSVQLRK